jgi:hypothetical protein
MVKATGAALAGALCVAFSLGAAAQVCPLPDWNFYGHGSAGNMGRMEHRAR